MSDLPEPLRTETVAAFPLEDSEQRAAGHLLVFGGSFNVIPLVSSDNSLVYLANRKDTVLLLWPDAAGGLARIEVTASATTFAGEQRHCGVALDVSGDWFGVQIPVKEIKARKSVLQPSDYFPKEIKPLVSRSPAELLADIKTSHQRLDRHIDYLLGITELRPLAQAQIPPPLFADAQPFGALNEVQQAVWQRMQSLVETYSSAGGDSVLTPKPFRAEDVGDAYPAADVQRALDLFERMGLIVRVSIGDAPYYRRVTEHDIVKVEAVK
jgi:hypothetical protein